MLAGKYRVERTLRQGAAGMVLAARHVRSGNHVAIRVLAPELAVHADVAAGFLQHAHDARCIRGEHAVRIDDVDTDESGTPFFVMDYLEGQSLGDLVESGGPLPPAAAVGLVEQALEAVAEAHALGIVHRDLRLEDLFLVLRPDGSPCVKVLGFGVSRPGGKDLATDAQADVRAVGMILRRLVHGELPRSQLHAGATCDLDAVLGRCLGDDPSRGIQGAHELALALAPHGSLAPPISPRRSIVSAIVGRAIAATLLVVLVGLVAATGVAEHGDVAAPSAATVAIAAGGAPALAQPRSRTITAPATAPPPRWPPGATPSSLRTQ
jgi:serine/threonine protein kinase